MLNFLIRLVLLLFALLFAASLAVAAVLLLAVWGLRYGWARLAGKAVTPWSVMFGDRFDPRAGFQRFRAASRRPGPTAADVAAAKARGDDVRSPVAGLRGGSAQDVTDVRARAVAGRG